MRTERKRRFSVNSFLISTLLLNSMLNAYCLSDSDSEHGKTRIRGGNDSNKDSMITSTNARMHPIRRIYGVENAAVRDEVHKLETESNQYWKSGIRADPSFKVGYVDHPYDPTNKNRRLEGDTSFMKPMRIHWNAQSLDNERTTANGARIDFIKNEILPRMSNFWSETLSVVPVDKFLKVQGGDLVNGNFCGDSEFSQVPGEHLSQGVADTDLILYISGAPSSRFCGPSTLAVAVACNWDQHDRPTAGAINFCINQISLDSDGTAHPSVISDNVDVAIHEAGHVLGMSSNSYRYFWNPSTARPRTARPIQAKTVTCVNGETKTSYIPNTNTLQFITGKNGVRAATIVTEKVRAVAQNQFNCAELEGAQLENQPTGNSCTGDHWDERLFYPESLSGVISPSTNIVSPLSLALFEDSGWYAANYSQSAVSPWGHGAGCDFVREPCLQKETNGDTTVPDFGRGYFCTKASQRGCSPSHSYKMACHFRDYGVSSSNSAPPPVFQYFSNPTLGGLKTADYCPIFGDNYKSNVHNLDCTNPENGDGVDWQGLGEEFGENSSCFESSRGEGICYNTQCINSEFKLKVQMHRTWYTCDSDFQEIEIPTTVSNVLGRRIICPRLSSVCPDMFCPANCAGRGVCNFEATVDGIQRPKCECFDSSDTSLGCTTSLVLDGKYIENSDGLFNVNVKGFFDDLIAVFVDDPETWSTSSWCWASGLFGVFLILLLCICSSFWPKKSNNRRNPQYGRRPPRRRRRRQSDDDHYNRKGYY